MKFLTVVAFLTFSINVFSSPSSMFKTNSDSLLWNSILAEVENDLPTKFKETIGKTVTINLKNLNGRNEVAYNCDESFVMGRMILGRVEIDPILLNEIEKGNSLIECTNKTNRHSTFISYLKATIVHELTHVLDRKSKTSKNDEFLNLSNWIRKGSLIKRRVNLNQSFERSPDAYEFKNPAETFAVNMEHYLYDKNFGCRRPLLNDFYNKLLNEKRGQDCKMNRKIWIDSSTSDSLKNDKKQISLDFNRLYQIHYLFAGKGQEVMSRFGHSMFRLVFCAPNKEVGPDCLKDITHHVVISYRATIDSTQISYADGITGEYPSQIAFLKLPSVVDEYTKGELREIRSLPLKLSSDQMERFLIKALEQYWSYSGKYYFFSNNCATESMNHLRVSMGDENSVYKKVINTPNGMYKYLVNIGLGDESVFDDIEEATKKGFYYASAADKVRQSFLYLNIDTTSIDDFVFNTSFDERKFLYDNQIALADNKVRTAANALRIEDLAFYAQNLEFLKRAQAYVVKMKDTPEGQELMQVMEEFNTSLGSDRTITISKNSYGIPFEEEVVMNDKTIGNQINQNEVTDKIKVLFKTSFEQELKELEGTMNNKVQLIKTISNR